MGAGMKGTSLFWGGEESPFALLCGVGSWLKKVAVCVETINLKCLKLTFAPGFFPFLGVLAGADPGKPQIPPCLPT